MSQILPNICPILSCLPQWIICPKYIIGPQSIMSPTMNHRSKIHHPTIYHVSTINHMSPIHKCVTPHLPRVLAPVLFCSVWFVAGAILRLPLFPALPPPRHSRRIVVSSHLDPWRPHQPEWRKKKNISLEQVCQTLHRKPYNYRLNCMIGHSKVQNE